MTISGNLAEYDQHCEILLDLIYFLDKSNQSYEAAPEADKVIIGEDIALV